MPNTIASGAMGNDAGADTFGGSARQRTDSGMTVRTTACFSQSYDPQTPVYILRWVGQDQPRGAVMVTRVRLQLLEQTWPRGRSA